MTLFFLENTTDVRSVVYSIIDNAFNRYDRVLVSFTSREEELFYDSMLWSYKKISFLPHGMAHEESPNFQPILLSDSFNGIHNTPKLFIAVKKIRFKEYDLLKAGIWNALQKIAIIINSQDISLNIQYPMYKDNLLRKLHDSGVFDIDIESVLHCITSVNISLYRDLKWSKIQVV
ncbi:DNA polymerase III subunit chi [Candidatus Fokinia crypta]|uniref:DNA polymerase III subunit chi n=1 Tax=Candidatus Fokinia crypta TaxID=1920990 RepID=A0ABZ0UTG1_9RICK|nr:DNA polymerase III subunit chi [Candidatus Fokinia cryptica]WPX97978.1 DNA polymerase III subunit chi [Candidatus Fokinia cryptica]